MCEGHKEKVSGEVIKEWESQMVGSGLRRSLWNVFLLFFQFFHEAENIVFMSPDL